MQKQRKPSIGDLILYVILAALILALLGTLFIINGGATMLSGLAPSCTIGVGSATVTVKGWSANNDCQAMLSGGYGNFTGIDWNRYQAYAASEPAANVQCEFDLAGRHVTIRDSGISTTGSGLCYLIQRPGQQ